MAWQWNQAPVGKITGNLTGLTNTLTVNGISGNAIINPPQTTVDKINIILDIGGKSLAVTEKLKYNSDNEVINNG